MAGNCVLEGPNLEKCGKFWKMWKMAGLGKYHMGGYGRIGVYRVNKPILMCISVKIKENISNIFASCYYS